MLKVPDKHADGRRERTLDVPHATSTARRFRPASSVSSRLSFRPQELSVEDFQPVAFFCLKRESKPRLWFIKLMCWPWFERVSILVIMVNCVTLGMYNPFDAHCVTERCQILESLETAIYAFFLVEMLIKWVAMGLFGTQGYFADSWNKLDCFIVAAGSFELAYGEGEYLSAVRSIRVLRPLRAINRVPSIRILVMLLLDTLPMLGNVLAICFFIFTIFGIIGVQLWQGLLRSRCFPDGLNETVLEVHNLSSFYRPSFDEPDYVCSLPVNNGLSKCGKQYFNRHGSNDGCNQTYPLSVNASSALCVDWNQYYRTCRDSGENIYYGSISFDNIGIATVAIFQIITLEGWTDIMYKIQDAHSFWNWLYFVVLILLGSYFMTNLCLVVITSQFQETKFRETEMLKISRLRSRASVSTVSSSFMQHGCYAQILDYLEHLCRRLRRRIKPWLKINKTSKRRRVRPCLQLKGRRDNVKCIHHHHHHYHYYHHYVHHPPCQCSNFELSDSPPVSVDPTEYSSSMSTPNSVEHSQGILQDNQDIRTPKEGKKILVVPQIQVFAQAATALFKDSGSNSSGEMVSTATANINYQGHDSSANIVTYSKTADSVAVASQATAQTIEAACSCAAQQPGEENVHVVTKEYDDSMDSSEDERDQDKNKGLNAGFRKFRNAMKECVECSHFTRVIMASIFLNTICMAAEHHGQPPTMTDVLEYLNIIFTSIFALEMMAKIMASGPYGYIKDAYNLFDGVIVILSVMDIFADNDDSGISVLRSFRLLRVFKLVRFMPALQRQLSVMVKTLDNVMTFLALLSLFIFTSSILGMHLFGGKYQFKNEDGRFVTSRANFDSLFWALVTVFQVLTQEDWNVVLYDGMRALSPWAALYFIFLMIIGNYILFNLLVAILVEGFADHSENERISMKVRKDSAAPASPSKPASALSPDLKHQLDKDFHLSWPNINVKLQDESPPSEHATRCKSAPGKRNYSEKPQRSSSYLHVLTIDTLETQRLAEETGDKSDGSRCSSPENEDASLVPHDAELSNNEHATSYKKTSLFKSRISWSLYLFSPENRFRRLMVQIHCHVWFDRVVLFFILFNCVVMALEEPGLEPNSQTATFVHVMQYIFTAIFTIEMSIKVVSMGLVIGPNTYLKSGWNVIDGALVVLSLVDLTISLATHSHGGILGVLRVFRAFRTLRPLRVINRAPELKLVVETLLSSLKPIGNVVLIAASFFTIFGILGVQLFKGKFYSCQDVEFPVEIRNKSECLANAGKWTNNEYNFDNLARALLTLFVFATRDGWVAIMYSGVDAVGVDKQPQRDHSKWNVLYFVAFLLLAGFVVLNMLVGIVVENFHKCRNELLREQNAQNLEKDETREGSRSDSVIDIDYQSFSFWRRKIFLLVTHDYFDLIIAVMIGINVLCMAMEHYQQPETVVTAGASICFADENSCHAIPFARLFYGFTLYFCLGVKENVMVHPNEKKLGNIIHVMDDHCYCGRDEVKDHAEVDVVLLGKDTKQSILNSEKPNTSEILEDVNKTTKASDLRKCVFCGEVGDQCSHEAGRLLYFNIDEWAHVNCVLWSAEVYEDDEGRLKNAHVALTRGRQLRCEFCGEVGATVGCCEPYCRGNFHFMCGRKAKAIFLPDKTVFCDPHSFRAKGKIVVGKGEFSVERRVCVDMSKIKTLKKVSKGVSQDSLSVLSGSMVIEDLGKLTKASDTSDLLIPVHYKLSRLFWSTENPNKRCFYTCQIEEIDQPEEKDNVSEKDDKTVENHVVTCHENDVDIFKLANVEKNPAPPTQQSDSSTTPAQAHNRGGSKTQKGSNLELLTLNTSRKVLNLKKHTKRTVIPPPKTETPNISHSNMSSASNGQNSRARNLSPMDLLVDLSRRSNCAKTSSNQSAQARKILSTSGHATFDSSRSSNKITFLNTPRTSPRTTPVLLAPKPSPCFPVTFSRSFRNPAPNYIPLAPKPVPHVEPKSFCPKPQLVSTKACIASGQSIQLSSVGKHFITKPLDLNKTFSHVTSAPQVTKTVQQISSLAGRKVVMKTMKFSQATTTVTSNLCQVSANSSQVSSQSVQQTCNPTSLPQASKIIQLSSKPALESVKSADVTPKVIKLSLNPSSKPSQITSKIIQLDTKPEQLAAKLLRLKSKAAQFQRNSTTCKPTENPSSLLAEKVRLQQNLSVTCRSANFIPAVTFSPSKTYNGNFGTPKIITGTKSSPGAVLSSSGNGIASKISSNSVSLERGGAGDSEGMAVVVGSADQITKLLSENPDMIELLGSQSTEYLGKILSSHSATESFVKQCRETKAEVPIAQSNKCGQSSGQESSSDQCVTSVYNIGTATPSKKSEVIDLTKDDKSSTVSVPNGFAFASNSNVRLNKIDFSKCRNAVRKLDRSCLRTTNDLKVHFQDESSTKKSDEVANLCGSDVKLDCRSSLSSNVRHMANTSPNANLNRQYIFHNRRFLHASLDIPSLQTKANRVSPLPSPTRIMAHVQDQSNNIKPVVSESSHGTEYLEKLQQSVKRLESNLSSKRDVVKGHGKRTSNSNLSKRKKASDKGGMKTSNKGESKKIGDGSEQISTKRKSLGDCGKPIKKTKSR